MGTLGNLITLQRDYLEGKEASKDGIVHDVESLVYLWFIGT